MDKIKDLYWGAGHDQLNFGGGLLSMESMSDCDVVLDKTDFDAKYLTDDYDDWECVLYQSIFGTFAGIGESVDECLNSILGQVVANYDC